MIFVGQPLDLGRRRSKPLRTLRPLRPLGYLELPMVNLGKPPLPLNRSYRWPLNYPKYVKDFDLDAHVIVFKVTIIKKWWNRRCKNC